MFRKNVNLLKVYQIWFFILLAVVSVIGLWIPSARAAEIAKILVSDPNTGCKVYIDSDERPGTGVIWKGSCTADKYANGDGTLYWTAGGEVYFLAHFAKSGGLIMENGHIRVDIPDDAMTFTFDKCTKHAGRVKAIVRRDVDVVVSPVLNSLVNRLVEQYKSACAESWRENGALGIGMTYEGYKGTGGYSQSLGMVVFRNGDKKFHYKGFWSDREEEVRTVNQKNREAAEQKRAAQNRQRQEQLQRALDQKAQAFADKYGATGGWVNWQQLSSNPFSYEGKTLVFNAEFERMVTSTSGIFSNVVFSRVPKNVFTHPGKVMLAGKVLGTTNIKNQFGGEVSVPHIRYLGHINCRDSDCDGYFRSNIRSK